MSTTTPNGQYTSFPPVIRDILQQNANNPTLCKAQIKTALRNRETLGQIKTWLEKNPDPVGTHPELTLLHRIALQKEAPKLFQKPYGVYLKSKMPIHTASEPVTKDDLIVYRFERLAFGLTNLDKCLHLLKKPDTDNFDPKAFATALPALCNLDAALIQKILSHRDKSGNILLCYPEIFPGALELLNKLESTQIVELFSIQMPYQICILHIPEVVVAIASVFRKLTPAQTKQLLQQPNSFGEVPLGFYKSGSAFVELVQDLEAEDIVELLTIRNKKNFIPITYNPVFAKLIPVFLRSKKPFSSEQIKRLLSTADKNSYAPLHEPKNIKLAKSLLATSPAKGPLTPEDFHELLHIADRNGRTILDVGLGNQVLSYQDIEPILENYIEFGKYSFGEIKHIFSTETERGNTFFQDPHIPAMVLPLFEKIAAVEDGLQLISDLLNLRDKDARTLLHTPGALKHFWPFLQKHFKADDLKKMVMITDHQGVNVLRAALMSSAPEGILNDLFGLNFDLTDFNYVRTMPEDRLKRAVNHWIGSAAATKEKSPLHLPLILGYMDIVTEKLEKMSRKEQEAFYEQVPEKAAEIRMHILLKDYILDESHMHKGRVVQKGAPAAVTMDSTHFGAHKKTYTEFYSFLPDFIECADAQGWVDEATKARLYAMEKKIRTNEMLEKMPENADERRMEYAEFCSYLTHIINNYKIDRRDNSNSEEKIKILKELAEATSNCFTRWKQEAKQRFFVSPGVNEIADPTPLNLTDCLHARLRTERIYLLTTKMLQFATGAVHEPNYLLNLFREELGTLLAQIQDPYSEYPDYPRNKEELRTQFDMFYNKGTILLSLLEHLNVQKHRKTESSDPIDLSADEVEFALREWARTSWHVKEFDNVAKRAREMASIGKSTLEISAFLEGYGIDWNQEESAEDAEKRLNHMAATLPRAIKDAINVLEEMEEAFSPLELDELMNRHPEITKEKQLTPIEFNQAVRARLDELVMRRKSLQAFREELKGASPTGKIEILKKHNFIIPGQTLDEVLDINNLNSVRVNKFIEEEVYDEERNFTDKAVVTFLEAMGVLKCIK